jgi:hypothetical protein
MITRELFDKLLLAAAKDPDEAFRVLCTFIEGARDSARKQARTQALAEMLLSK